MTDTTTTTTTTKVVDASDILSQNKFATHLVDKEDTLLYDLGNLCAFDYSSIDKTEYSKNKSEYLNKLARENVQLLITRMFQLPIKSADDGALGLLPKPITLIPRQRSLPEEKPKTRWEAFAEIKGIKKRKKDKMAWDEKEQDFKPTYGFKKANDDSNDWAMLPDPNNPNQDPYEKKEQERLERIDKNKRREQRNLDESSKRSSSNLGKELVYSKENRPQIKRDVENTFNVARISTASLGKFDKQLDGEKKAPTRGVKRLAGLDDAKTTTQEESQSNLKILDRMFNKQSVVNTDKAVNQFIGQEQKENMKQKLRENSNGTKKHKRNK